MTGFWICLWYTIYVYIHDLINIHLFWCLIFIDFPTTSKSGDSIRSGSLATSNESIGEFSLIIWISSSISWYVWSSEIYSLHSSEEFSFFSLGRNSFSLLVFEFSNITSSSSSNFSWGATSWCVFSSGRNVYFGKKLNYSS